MTALSKLLSVISAPWSAAQLSGGSIRLFSCCTDVTKKNRRCSVHLCALVFYLLSHAGSLYCDLVHLLLFLSNLYLQGRERHKYKCAKWCCIGVFVSIGDPADGGFSVSCRRRQCTPCHDPCVCLIHRSICDFGWCPVCLPHCHPLWMLLGGCSHRCLPPLLCSSSASITLLSQFLCVCPFSILSSIHHSLISLLFFFLHPCLFLFCKSSFLFFSPSLAFLLSPFNPSSSSLTLHLRFSCCLFSPPQTQTASLNQPVGVLASVVQSRSVVGDWDKSWRVTTGVEREGMSGEVGEYEGRR